jgi:phospholipid-binding lipoprotein MlaA
VGTGSGADPDPWEKLNRKSYGLFVYLDSHAIRPAAVFYGHAVPHPIRQGLHNAIRNVNSPVIFFNDVLQLHGAKAMQTLGRFVINSTVGVAGLSDVAARSGIPYHENGFGTTLGRYGVGPGPFLFIPVIGPSDVRDALGSGVDALSDPLTWIRYTGRWEVGAAKTVVGGLDTRYNADPQLKVIDATATDPYATLRSLYLQNRAAQINGGQVNVNDLPDFGPEPAESGPAASAPATPSDSEPAAPPPPASAPQPPSP